MENICEANNEFDFKQLILLKPQAMTGGHFFIRYLKNDSPLYIQPPKCILKQGLIKAGKRIYCDLMFTNNNDSFIQWVENLESSSQQGIFENRSKWFETELEMHDIENSFASSLKIFKSGKYYIMRVNVPCILGKCDLKVYDEDETEILSENIMDNTNAMAILEFKGIKCSARSFHVDIELKQLMVLNPTILFDKCILKSKKNSDDLDSCINNVCDLGNKEENNNLDAEAYLVNEVPKKVQPNIKDGGPQLTNQRLECSPNECSEINSDMLNLGNTDLVIAPYPIPLFCSPNKGSLVQSSITDKEEDNNGYSEINNDFLTLGNTEGSLVQLSIAEKEEGANILQECEFNLEEIATDNVVQIKDRNEVYYEMYKDAKKKARFARNLALSAYLEAKRIKNTYLLTDLKDEDESDIDEDSNYESKLNDIL